MIEQEKAVPPAETTADIPRPEYPRPLFKRDKWLNLNGLWEFSFDDAERGYQLGWSDGRNFDGRILVPFPYQTKLSGINDKGIHEVIWYARDISKPDEWLDSDLLLHFGAVDYSTTVYVNGKEVGSNRGGHVPFAFDIAPYMQPGSNRLTLRVEDRKDPYQPRGKQSSTGMPFGIDYYCSSGIWQTVWLEPVPPLRLDSIRVTPVVEERAFELRVFLHAPSAGYDIEAEVWDDGECIAKMTKYICSATARLFVRIPDCQLWSPENPQLYQLKVRLYRAGMLLDEIESYVGLRSVELRNGTMNLNGKPTFMKMVLAQGYWPEGYLAAPSDEALRADVEWAKSFGFNGIRMHQKIEDPRWLYWCDKLGMMVWGEMPNGRAWSPRAEELLVAEWTRAVERDFNNPCIVTWVPVNESMGFPELIEGHPGQYAFLERMVINTRRIDPERPVIDNDGWEHTDVTDICAIHDYSDNQKKLLARYRDTIKGKGLPKETWLAEKPVFARGSRYRNQPVMLTEVGGFLFRPPDKPEEALDILYANYGTVFSFEELPRRYRDLMEGISKLPFVSGFCYTQLTDVEQELNGLLTYDRVPKVAPEIIKGIHDMFFKVDEEGS